MFIGHFAVGLGGKRAAPRVSLGTLFLAAEFLDLLWPTLVLLGIETVRIAPGITPANPLDFVSYPISHSLAAALLWSVLFGAVYWAIRRRFTNSLVLGIVVMSHWILDFIAHRPDLQLAPGLEARVGLGLWYSRPASLAVELGLFFIGAFLYARTTRARDGAGRYGFAALMLFLIIAYLAAFFGPPPPDVPSLAWTGESAWLIVVWGYWLDRHRSVSA